MVTAEQARHDRDGQGEPLELLAHDAAGAAEPDDAARRPRRGCRAGTSGRNTPIRTVSAPAAASTPSGFAIPAAGASSRVPGVSTISTGTTTITAAEAHATNRQRGEGSRPSGNSRTTKVPMGRMISTQVPSYRAATAPAPGNDPGRSWSPTVV